MLNEDNQLYKQGGIILIKGMVLDDNTQRLYVTYTKNILSVNRKKTNDSDAQAAKMAKISNNIYRISIIDDKLIVKGVAWSSHDSMAKIMNLKNDSVVLNNNKTPIWWETLKYNDINRMINSFGSQITTLPGIRWLG